MVNCAHPSHFAGVIADGGAWRDRIGGLRANASALSHAELDDAEELDEGDPAALGARLRRAARASARRDACSAAAAAPTPATSLPSAPPGRRRRVS